MKSLGRLTVRCRDATLARSLGEVLAPDNTGVPKDQRFSMSRRHGSLVFTIESPGPSALLSTALSILTDATLFQEVWLLSRGQDAEVGRRH